MSRQIALQTRSEALSRTKRVLNARQGMEGAKNAYRAFQEVRRADTPNQGLSGRQESRQPPAKPICTVQAATRLAGGRRPSVLQRWGSGVIPRRFPVALKALPEPWRLGRFEARFPRSLVRKPSPWLVNCRKRALMFYRINGAMSRLSATDGALLGD